MDGKVSLLRALDNGTTWWMGGSSSGGGVKDRHSGLRVLSYHKSKPVGCANPRRFQYNALFHTFFAYLLTNLVPWVAVQVVVMSRISTLG